MMGIALLFMALMSEIFELIKKILLFPFRIFKKKRKKNSTAISDSYQFIKCKGCSVNLRIPQNRGLVNVTCPKCKTMFRFDTGLPKDDNHFSVAKAKNTSTSNNARSAKKQDPAASYGSQNRSQDAHAQTRNRTVTIHRLMHEYKNLSGIGIANTIKDAKKVTVYLDGTEQGLLNNDHPMVLKIDGGQHTIGRSARSTGNVLPAGNDNFVAFFFNGNFKIGLVQDTFRDNLTNFVINMVRTQGFRERILDSNNLNHAVEVSICRDYIWIHWRLAQTRGLKEWATGEKSEKIYYNKIGLIPTEENRQPSGYWEYLESYVHETILSDEEADLQRDTGGFSFRTEHGLY